MNTKQHEELLLYKFASCVVVIFVTSWFLT